jgi:hypothetical protein
MAEPTAIQLDRIRTRLTRALELALADEHVEVDSVHAEILITLPSPPVRITINHKPNPKAHG